MDHSDKFWAEVKLMFPEYMSAKKWLKANSRNLSSF